MEGGNAQLTTGGLRASYHGKNSHELERRKRREGRGEIEKNWDVEDDIWWSGKFFRPRVKLLVRICRVLGNHE